MGYIDLCVRDIVIEVLEESIRERYLGWVM